DGTVSAGAVVSCTVTLNVPVAVLPWASVAEQVTVVVPRSNVDPDAGEHDGVIAPSTMSVAVGVKVIAAPAGPVASWVMSSGSVSTGACVSDTFTVNVLSALLPAASLAVQVTVVSTSSGKVSPDAGSHVTSTVPSTRSVAVGLVKV